jgi:hypothetical protein
VSEADVRAAREAAAELDRAHARMQAGAVSVAVAYLPGVSDRITVDGRPIEPGTAIACAGPTTLDLPGLGRLTLAPGGDAVLAAREAARAEAALRTILAPSGADDLAGLLAIAERRAAAEARAARADAELAGLAPQGRAALEAEIAGLRDAAAGADPDAPDPAAATEAEAGSRADLDASEGSLTAAREARLAAVHADAAAREKCAESENVLAATVAECETLSDRASLAGRAEECRTAAAAADRKADALVAAIPDAAAAETALDEAQRAVRDAEARRQQLATRDAELGARIAARADEGAEERRDEIAGRSEEATARAAGYAAEARALTRLRDALAAARAAARERYLAPVADELAPLLGLVLDGAELRLHPTRLLPETLARAGLDEELARLSGGTREQIAILTRLAFARLLARSGRATPVILDDALVYADDARFARVLAAASAVAGDVQVILLTCRERAFATLPASRPMLSLEETQAAAAG